MRAKLSFFFFVLNDVPFSKKIGANGSILGQPRYQGLSSLPPLSLSSLTTMEAEKRDPGNEVDSGLAESGVYKCERKGCNVTNKQQQKNKNKITPKPIFHRPNAKLKMAASKFFFCLREN